MIQIQTISTSGYFLFFIFFWIHDFLDIVVGT